MSSELSPPPQESDLVEDSFEFRSFVALELEKRYAEALQTIEPVEIETEAAEEENLDEYFVEEIQKVSQEILRNTLKKAMLENSRKSGGQGSAGLLKPEDSGQKGAEVSQEKENAKFFEQSEVINHFQNTGNLRIQDSPRFESSEKKTHFEPKNEDNDIAVYDEIGYSLKEEDVAKNIPSLKLIALNEVGLELLEINQIPEEALRRASKEVEESRSDKDLRRTIETNRVKKIIRAMSKEAGLDLEEENTNTLYPTIDDSSMPERISKEEIFISKSYSRLEKQPSHFSLVQKSVVFDNETSEVKPVVFKTVEVEKKTEFSVKKNEVEGKKPQMPFKETKTSPFSQLNEALRVSDFLLRLQAEREERARLRKKRQAAKEAEINERLKHIIEERSKEDSARKENICHAAAERVEAMKEARMRATEANRLASSVVRRLLDERAELSQTKPKLACTTESHVPKKTGPPRLSDSAKKANPSLRVETLKKKTFLAKKSHLLMPVRGKPPHPVKQPAKVIRTRPLKLSSMLGIDKPAFELDMSRFSSNTTQIIREALGIENEKFRLAVADSAAAFCAVGRSGSPSQLHFRSSFDFAKPKTQKVETKEAGVDFSGTGVSANLSAATEPMMASVLNPWE